MNGSRLETNREKPSLDALNRTIEGLEARIDFMLNPLSNRLIERPPEPWRDSDALAGIVGRQRALEPRQHEALERLASQQAANRHAVERHGPNPVMQNIAATLAIIQDELARGSLEPEIPDPGMAQVLMDGLDALGDRVVKQFGGFERRLEEIGNSLAAANPAQASSQSEARLLARIERLSQRMEELANQEAVEELKTRIDRLSGLIDQYPGYRPEYDIVGSLADLSRKLDRLEGARLNEPMLERLEKLIFRIEERDQGQATDGFQTRLGVIEGHLANHDDYILEAARQTGQAVIAALRQEPADRAGQPQESAALARLAENLRALDEFSRSNEARSLRTLGGLQESLMRVADRLSDLDGHIAQTPVALPRTEPPMPKAADLRVDLPGPRDDFIDANEEQRSKGIFELIGSTLMGSGKARPDERERATGEAAPALDSREILPAEDSVELIEPGSSAAIKQILEKVRAGKAATQPISNFDRIDIIASARRAAEAAQAEADTDLLAKSHRLPAKKNRGLFERHRATALLVASLFLLGALAYPLVSRLNGAPSATSSSAQKPVSAQRPGTKPRQAAPVGQRPAPPAKRSASQDMLKPPVNANGAKPLVNTAKVLATESLHVPATFGAPLSEAAKRGDTLALFEIGARYSEGRGVAFDLAKAFTWYERAAAKGFAPAQTRLADFYNKGKGVALDPIRAKALYLQAAASGNVEAMHQLAVLCVVNADPDFATAVKWFEQAANYGMANSQFNLAILHAQGRGVSQNLEQAYHWFAIAARYGDKDAAIKRDELATALSAQQLANGKAKADGWKPQVMDQRANSLPVPASWINKSSRATSLDMKKAVRNIQAILNNNGFQTGIPDGALGGRTVSAIKAFQASVGIAPTGNIDNALVRELLARNKKV